jgi:ribosome-binding ATPase
VQIAIVGLAGSGKTTVFNTLTRGHAETGGYGGVTLNVGVVKVPDERLGRLAQIFKPKKIVQADVTYVDLPAPPASTEGRIGTEELPADHLARLRESDALLHVVRAFDDPAHPHPAGSVDPARDLEQLDLEFTLADLAMAERRLERLKTSGRHGTQAEREAAEREEIVVRRVHEGLEAGTPIRDLDLDADDAKAIRGFRFLTEKPVLVLLNVGEGELANARALVERIASGYRHEHALVDAMSAKIEMELGELEPDEAAVFMDELGITDSSLDRVIALSYRLLGLVSFLTAGPDEVRAWPIPDGSTAVDAAAAIHTDLAKGFIRAETVAYEDLLSLGSMAEAKKAGRLRSEGKTYRVKDGDVLEILFSRGSGGQRRWRAAHRRRTRLASAVATSVLPAEIRVEVGEDRAEVASQRRALVVRLVVVILVVKVGLELGEEVVGLLGRHIHRRHQPVVADIHEAVVALEDHGDRLDQRVLLVVVLDVRTDALDELEELLRLPLRLAHDEDVGIDLVVAFMEFVEEHGSLAMLVGCGSIRRTPGATRRTVTSRDQPVDRRFDAVTRRRGRPRRLGRP